MKSKKTLLSSLQNSTKFTILRTWQELSSVARSLIGSIDKDLPLRDLQRIRNNIYSCLYAKGGEVSTRRNTVSLGHIYLNLSETGKLRFFYLLSTEFGLDEKTISQSIESYQASLMLNDIQKKYAAIVALKSSLESDRSKVLRQFNSLENGLKFIIDMRGDVLKFSREHSALLSLDHDLKTILQSWFDVGLLDLKQITWHSSAMLLEKLIAYEAVHTILSWKDLRNRLDFDRRCFAFFHHKMPNEPIIFIEVALSKQIINSIQELLDEKAPTSDPTEATTAIFYSISNAQKGLRGIPLGNFLIKRVVEQLLQEFKSIKNFLTLSPIPGFSVWLLQQEESFLHKFSIKKQDIEVKTNSKLKQPLLKLCAYYLLNARNKHDKALDAVAHFHLSNGAYLKALKWNADLSVRGLSQSYGIMANYHYDLTKIDSYHEEYLSNNTINCSRIIQNMSC